MTFRQLGFSVRVFLSALAGFLIFHGIWGPQFAPKNLTTLFVWVHYRGLLVLSLLIFGNLFCGGCPLVLSRNIARRFISPRYRWPNRLRNKWLAVILFISVLFVYENFDLWASPKYTALLLAGFFASILFVDLLFKDASFCRYICPVGQFNFLASTLSPFEVTAKNIDICRTCKTFDCIKGSESHRGCELKLFIPKKKGNMDCTFCMDCQKACPHDNVTVSPRFLKEKRDFEVIWNRKDLALLTLIFTFGGLLNAFAMVNPSYELQQVLAEWLAVKNETFLLTLLFLGFLVVAPSLCLLAIPGSKKSKMSLIPALLPLGFSIWLGHYCFHFLTGALTFVPLVWRSLPVSQPSIGFWAAFPMGLPAAVVTPIQIGIMVLGTLGSILAAQTVADRYQKSFLSVLPWHLLFILIAAFAMWTFSLPMQMRGTILGA